MRIAIDAMGGDFAPRQNVSGAISAARRSKGRLEIVLVGDKVQIQNELTRHFRIQDLPLSIHHASEKVEMDESPASALKQKKDASISVAMQLHKEGKVDAVVSAGNTGAALGSALFQLRKIRGVNRPAIGSLLPNGRSATLLIDAGTNVDCKPHQLLEFGIMGSIYMRQMFGIANPRVGLINIGSEKGKGNEQVQATYELLEQSNLNFIGNIEGGDILRDKVDVAVCDGFVGNVILKFAESFNQVFSSNLRRRIGKRLQYLIGAYLLRPAFRHLKRTFDYAEYGGVPLLGVNGVVIICHGSSSPKAIRNAVFVAERIINQKVNEKIEQHLNLIEAKSGTHL
ncbi:MAG: phosphate acyltransferase PlsX [candidate division KSB1 bacterium]|nr:phosphate acyltransferase PlsX [candidate division KSB1 bacterium]MDZ7335759.1 phosphate acyltransferase PlsX [candidate division KSB1 bacterium]MDZ7357490.1 phosphate acyltransferase PlsX [candidate division KSB1 bacterium]MDZ7402073.1 phosphate acyltransferase PlsX [candidate division KSB1 bacterium]